MKTLYHLLVAVMTLGLVGCSGTMPLTESEFNTAGEVVEKTAGYTADASVAKEHEVHATLRHRDKMHAKMYAQSGFQVKFEFQEVAPGVKVQVMKEVSFKEAPRFDHALPTAPSVHPLWGVMQNLGGAAIQWTGIGFVAGKFTDMISHGWEHAAPQYNGPYNPVTDSYNATAEPFFTPVP